MRVRTQTAVYSLGAILAMTAVPATAQSIQTRIDPTQAVPTQTVPSRAGSNETSTVEEVVVTGSRISRRDYTSVSPIVTLGAEAVAASGSATLENTLNILPQVTPSASASASFVARGGQASINLRGIGQQRTLVLVDGRRMQPSGADGSVDLNVIPSALIENIEVITGGASAIYGSDAVAGVVNLKLRQRFSGLEIGAQAGVTGEGDGETRTLDLLVGGNFAEDRGNAYVALGYSEREPVNFRDRDYLEGQALSPNLPSSLVNVSATNLPSQAAVNAVFARYGVAPGSVARSAVLSTNNDGTLFVPTGAINYRGGETAPFRVFNGSVYTNSGNSFWAQTPLERSTVVAHATYDVTDTVTAFADALFTHYEVETRGAPTIGGSSSGLPLVIPITNPFIPTDLRAVLASRPNPGATFTIAQAEYQIGDRREHDDYDVYQFTAGLKGETGISDITWNVFGTVGRTSYLATQINYPSTLAMNRLLQAPDGGASLCAGGLNPFGVNPLSAACLAYINRTARNTTVLEQQILEANIQGRAFDLPAGEARFAAGVGYRNNSYAFQSDDLIRTGELANYLPILPSSGSQSVTEAYGELLVPVLRDLPFVEELTLDLGYRYSDYDTVGGVSTYKADLDWKVVEAVRLRGGYARAIRAPSVGELFAASSQGQLSLGTPGIIGAGDPCDVRGAYRAAGSPIATQVRALCLAQGIPAALIDGFTNANVRTPFQTSGNLDLQPETSDTYSVGAVFRSTSANPLFAQMSGSIDYFSISLEDAIGVVTNTVVTSQCFDTTANPGLAQSNFYCGLIGRDPATGQITTLQNPQFNLGGYTTAGIDVAGEWRAPFDAMGLPASLGALTFSTNVSYLTDFSIQTLPNGRTLDYAGTIGNTQIDQFATAHPKWKATTSLGWSVGDVRTTVRWRYLDGMRNAGNVGTGGTAHGVPPVSYYDLDASWQVREGLELRAGVQNLADTAPPTLNDVIIGNVATDVYTYDIVGRRFNVALKARF